MTICKNYKEYVGKDGRMYFIERYADKPDFVWFWRYGMYLQNGLARTLSDQLMCRPNLKRLGLV